MRYGVILGILAFLLIILTGCSTVEAFLMKYDGNEYKLATDIRVKANLSQNSCNDQTLSKINSKEIADATTALQFYAENLPHNKPMQDASTQLNQMAQGFTKMYDSGKVSEVFCKIKFKNLEDNAAKLQMIEGGKPK